VSGQPTGQTMGRFVAFKDFKFALPPSGKVTLVDSLNGGEAEMEAAEVIEWRKRHRLLGDREEGFWLHEEPAPAVSGEEQQNASRAAMHHDVGTLEKMLEQERAGWARPDFIATLEGTLGEVKQIRAELEAELEKSKRKQG
jgi:hypothetical protein